MNKRIQIIYRCNQNWDDMDMNGCQRFCQQCEKVVHDFTKTSLDEIEPNSEGDLCGLFRIEQVEPDLIPLNTPKIIRNATFAISAIIGIGLTNVNAQNTTTYSAIEMVDSQPNDSSHINLQKGAVQEKKPSKATREKPKIQRKKWYLSRRFPFLHKRPVRLGGRFRH